MRIEDFRWIDFYEWLKIHNYDLVREHNVFRGNIFIIAFDPQEDGDSGEIQETMESIMEKDHWNFKHIKLRNKHR